ncbi:hypothetical protein AZA_88238 [Nitrospirillum viridazoti Y2]|nr:hypothetical protein AZA_88238 [Nitrospirillum amazonense Y2]
MRWEAFDRIIQHHILKHSRSPRVLYEGFQRRAAAWKRVNSASPAMLAGRATVTMAQPTAAGSP